MTQEHPMTMTPSPRNVVPTVGVEDAPRPDEILVVMAVSDGGGPDPRVGAGRLAV